MTRLFSGKSNAIPVNIPIPKAAPPAPPSTASKKTVPLDLSSINLGIESTSKNFDSMSTKSATSSKPDEITNDMSRLIDANDNDDDDDDDGDNDRINNILNKKPDFDFLNNW